MQSTPAADKKQLALADVFPQAAIRMQLEHRTKEGVIRELVRHLISVGSVRPEDEAALVTHVMERETLGTTALGNGVAFPHCCSELTERFAGALGIDKHGVPFESVDGAPVYAIFLLVVPLAARARQYEVLGKITALGRDKGLRVQLRGCRTAEAVHRLLKDLE